MMTKSKIDDALLRDLYVNQGLYAPEIARRLGCHRRTVDKRLRKLGIPPRIKHPIVIEKPCLRCGKLTRNPKYCSRSCAAIDINHIQPKRKRKVKEFVCVSCGKPTKERRKYCDDCAPNSLKWLTRSIGVLSRDGYYQMYRVIRALARRIYKESGRPLVCQVCGYATHVEISHLRAISSFDKEALIAQVNDLDNLVAFCPNHHWEFDNGLIDLGVSKATSETS